MENFRFTPIKKIVIEPFDLSELLDNGIIFTSHAKEKMFKEDVTVKDIYEVLISGVKPIKSRSVRNDKSRAWNEAPHYTVTYNNLTVVVCQSLERKVLVCTVYHGKPFEFMSNPYNQIVFNKANGLLSRN